MLAENPAKIDVATLNRFPEFVAFRQRRDDDAGPVRLPSSPAETASTNSDVTPEELFALSYQRLQSNLQGELLDQIKRSTPAFFEQLVIDLLVAMGYGGSRQDAGSVIGRSGDEGRSARLRNVTGSFKATSQLNPLIDDECTLYFSALLGTPIE